MSIKSSHAKLLHAAKELAAQWNHTLETWHDDNVRKFEEQYIRPLEADLRTTAMAMERMDNTLEALRRDCQ